MAASQRQVAELELRLRDFVSKEMKRAGRNVKKEATAMQKVWKGVSKAVKVVGAAVMAAFSVAVFKGMRDGIKRAVEFSHAMQEVRTIMDESSMSFKDASKNVSDLALELGRSEIEVAKALYQTLSAGVTDTAEAMLMLRQSGRLAVAALMSTNDATDLLTNTFNAYGMEINENTLTATSDLMQQTIRLGKVIGPELAHSLGYVMPIAANLGVSLKELNAMLAALTLGGMNAGMASTQLRQAMAQLLHPTDDAKDLLKEFGLNVSIARIKAEGFLPVLADIKTTFGDNAKALQTLFPNIRGLIGIMALAGNQFSDVQRIMGEFDNSAGATEVAFDKMQQSLQVKMSKLKEAWTQAWKAIGESMLGAMDSMSVEEINARADAIRGIGEANAESFEKLGAGLSATFAHIAASIGPVLETQNSLTYENVIEGLKKLIPALREAGWEAQKYGDAISSLDYKDLSDGQRENLNTLIKHTQTQRGYAIALAESARFTNDLTDAGVKYRKGLADEIKGMGASVDMWRNTLDMMDKFSYARDAVMEGKITFETMLTLHGPGTKETQDVLKEIQATIDSYKAAGGLVADLELTDSTKSVLAAEARRLRGIQSALTEEAGLRQMHLDADAQMWAEFSEFMLREAQGDLRDLTEARVEADEAALASRKFFFKLESELGSQSLSAQKDRIDAVERMDLQAFQNKKNAAWIALRDSDEFALLTVEHQVEASEDFRRLWDADSAYYGALLAKRTDNAKRELDREARGLRSFSEIARGLLEQAWDNAGGAIEKSWKETLKDLKTITAAGIADLFPEGTGEIAGLVSPTAKQELDELNRALVRAAAQLHIFQGLAEKGLMPAKTVSDLQANIENVRLFALQEAIAAEETERLGFAMRDLAGKSGSEYIDALGSAGIALQYFSGESVQTAAEAMKNLRDQAAAAREEIARLRDIPGMDTEQLDAMAAMVEKTLELKLATYEAALSADALKKSWEDNGASWQNLKMSFGAGVMEWGDQLQTMSENVQELGFAFTDGLSGAIMEFASNSDDASHAWSRFADSFLLRIAEMIIQQAIFNLLIMLGNALGGGIGNFITELAGEELAMGGVVSGGLGRALPVKGYASGGPIVNSPHVAVIGEGKMNEAVVPLPDGRSIPVQMQGGGGGGAEVTFNIEAVDSRGIDELLFQKQDLISGMMQRALREDRAFRGAFKGK